MRPRTIIIALLAIVLLVPISGIGLIYLFGIDRLRPIIETQIESALQRDVELRGPVGVAWSLRPTVTAEQVMIAKDAGRSRLEMARIGRLEVKIAVLPLLAGAVEIDRVRLTGADILLEQDAAGRGNWELGTPPAEQQQASPEAQVKPAGAEPSTGGAPAIPRLADIQVTNSQLVYRAADATPIKVAIDQLTLDGASLTAPWRLTGQGTFRDRSFEVDGEIGPVPALVTRSQPVAFQLEAALAGSDLEVQGTYDPTKARPTVTATVKSRLLDIVALTAGSSDAQPAETGRGNGRKSRQDKATRGDRGGDRGDRQLFADTRLDFDRLKAGDVQAELRVDELRLPSGTMTEVAAQLTVVDGKLDLQPATLRVADGVGRVALAIDSRSSPPAIQVALELDDVDLRTLAAELGVRDAIDSRLALAAKLDGRGETAAAIAGSLTGQIAANAGEGRLRSELLDRLFGGARDVAHALLGGGGDEWVVLRCGVFDLPVRDGIVETRLAVVDTELTTLRIDGTIDLGTERLDLTVLPRARAKGLDLVVPVEISGRLAKPKAKIDEKAAAKQAATTLLGVLGDSKRDRDNNRRRRNGAGGPCAALATIDDTTAAPIQPDGIDRAGRDQPDTEHRDRKDELLRELGRGLGGILGGNR